MKCTLCNRKISPVEQEYCKCQKCGHTYCQKHRFPTNADFSNGHSQSSENMHKCNFNYFEQNKLEVTKHIEQDRVCAEKVIKI